MNAPAHLLIPNEVRSHDGTAPPTLKELGISKTESSRAQALDAERKMGEMLRETERQKPGQYQQRSLAMTVAPTLDELGLTKRESASWASCSGRRNGQRARRQGERSLPHVVTTLNRVTLNPP
jgi:hypothetical protein